MKTLRYLLILLLFSSCTSGQVTTYTVHKGETYCTPTISGTCGEKLEYYFRLDSTWSQLYQSPDNSTHKICGVSDIFGRNSLRLGVRRADRERNGLIACPYIHNRGQIVYTAFKDSTGVNLLLKYNVKYFCSIKKIGNAWSITLYEGQTKIAYSVAQINISSIGRRLSGVYVEVGSGGSLWDIRTDISFIKQHNHITVTQQSHYYHIASISRGFSYLESFQIGATFRLTCCNRCFYSYIRTELIN